MLNIIANFDKGNTTFDTAATAIGTLLSGNEITDLARVQRANSDGLDAITRDDRGLPSTTSPRDKLPLQMTPQQAGQFLVVILGDRGALDPYMKAEFPVPSPGPQ